MVSMAASMQGFLIDILLSYPYILVYSLVLIYISSEHWKKIVFATSIVIFLLKLVFVILLTYTYMPIVEIQIFFSILIFIFCFVQIRRLSESNSTVQTKIEPSRAFAEIIIVCMSLSLDSSIAARGGVLSHPLAAIFGISLSVAVLSTLGIVLAKLMKRYQWLDWLALAPLLYFAFRNAYEVIK